MIDSQSLSARIIRVLCGMAIIGLWVIFTGCRLQSQPSTETPIQERTSLPLPTQEGQPSPTPLQSQLTHPAPATMPAITATLDPGLDGLEVVYTRDEKLWLWRRGEASPLATSGPVFSPRLSSDGQVAAFLRPVDDYHIELWAINLDGRNERRLVSVMDLDAAGGTERDPNAVAIIPHRFQWLSGTHRLAFNTEYVYQGPGTTLLDDFNLVDADSLELSYQLLAGWGGEFTVSPDGGQIALTTPTNVILANLDGSNWRSVFTYEPVITYSEYRYYADPVWSPDGSYLQLAMPPKDALAEPAEATTIYRIDAQGSSIQEIGQVNAVPFFDTPVEFSPDRSHLIYVQTTGAEVENTRTLFIAASDGSGNQAYHEGYLLQFQGWSPDGRHFTFSTGEDQEMYLGGVDQPAAVLNQNPYGIFNLRWLDEEHFIYMQGLGEIIRLCLSTMGGETLILDILSGSRPEYDFLLK